MGGDALKAWSVTLKPRYTSSANLIGPSADPMAYWTLAVFPESFALGTLPLTHRSELVIRNGSESIRVQGL